MAVALEGVDLVAIALFIFLLAFLHATKATLVPLLTALHKALGWVPFVGDLISRTENAVIAGMNDAIAGVEEVISVLWAGLVWSFNELIDGLSWAWNEAAAALEHGFSVTIPDALTALWRDTQHLSSVTGKAVGGVEARIVDAVKEAERYASKEAARAQRLASSYADTAVAKLGRTLDQDVGALAVDLRAVEKAATHALTVAEQAATVVPSTVTTIIDKTVPGTVSKLDAEVRADLAAVAGELPQLPGLAWDDIEAVLRSKEFGTLAGLLAAVPLVNALVQALATETGLSNAECRAKVKQLCATDPRRWEHLLASLGFAFAWPGLDEFADALHAITEEVADSIVAFVGLA